MPWPGPNLTIGLFEGPSEVEHRTVNASNTTKVVQGINRLGVVGCPDSVQIDFYSGPKTPQLPRLHVEQASSPLPVGQRKHDCAVVADDIFVSHVIHQPLRAADALAHVA